MIRQFILFLVLGVLFGSSAQAQEALNPARDKPLEITADESLEWKRPEKIFVARGQAEAKQGDVAVKADTLTANYRDDGGSGMEIWRVTAADNVVIHMRESHVYGDLATYDLDRGVAVMTGKNLRMVAPDHKLTANENFEYWVSEGRVVAHGDPVLSYGTETLSADKLTAVLMENKKGQRVLKSLTAKGNVVISTPQETVRGDKGVYDALSNKAMLTGGVSVTRGPNILEGERAEVDLNTSTSRLFGPAEGGRVRGVFYPE